jgi:hypothetical protein
MQKIKSKTMAILIAIFLMLSMTASTMLIPNASAHTPAWNIPTYAYVVVQPTVVGVGQTALVDMFLGNAPIPSSAIANAYRYHNYNLTITAPDGKVTNEFYATVQDTTDNQIYSFTPTKVGTYNITFNYEGQTLGVNDQPTGSLNINDTYLPSSYSCQLTVQQNPVPVSPVPFSYSPSAYWTRPIYGENSFWFPYASNWLGTGSPVSSLAGSGTISGFGTNSFAERTPGDAVGSLTGHIMWTYPIEPGGVVGGNGSTIQGNTYFEGSAYEQRFTNPIIVDGMLIYNPPVSFVGSNSGPTTCQDSRTGKILWQSLPASAGSPGPIPNSPCYVPPISFAYIYDVQDGNQHGTYEPILFTSNFGEAFNAYNGYWLFNVTGVPSGTAAQGPQGEQLRYVITNQGNATVPNWNLAEWNSTLMWNALFFHPTQGSPSAPTIDTSSSPPYFSPTYSLLNSTYWDNNVLHTTSINYTAITSAVNASVFDSTDVHNRFDWNVSIPWLNVIGNQTLTAINNATGEYYIKGYSATGANPDAFNPASVLYALYNNVMILRNGSLPSLGGSQSPYTYFAIDLNPTHATLGKILWMQTYNPPAGNITVSQGPIDPTAGVFTEGYKETTQWVGYNMYTGAKLWTTNGQAPLDYFGNPIYPYVTGMCAYGNLYSCGQAGILYAYNMTTGALEWTYGNGGAGNTTESYFQRPGNFPIEINAIGGGVLYVITTEHTVETPILKGAMAAGVNATSGQELWRVSDYTGEFGSMSYAIADGQSVFYNGYDDQIYDIGQGPSATTVTAPSAGLSFGQSVVIKGTVMDVSAGTKQAEQAGDFPNGVPVASDASMTAWMGYVYQQQPMPTNFTGVPVTIDVLDSNGNYRTIGTATTDATGMFSLTWTPDIPGNYTVIATFASTNGYWPSSAQNAFTVMQAPAATATPTPAPASVVNTYFVPAVIAIIVVIIIGFAVLFLALRKRP